MFRPVPLLPFLLIAGSAALLAVLTATSARQGVPRPLRGEHVLVVRHSPVFRWSVLLAAVLIPFGLTVALRYYPPRRVDVPTFLGLYLVATGLLVPLVWEAGRFYVLATADGLEGRSGWRGVRVIVWDDVEAVSYRPLLGGFEFRGRDGATIRATAFAAGLAELFRLVEANVPPGALKRARAGYARIERPFPALPDEPVLEARPPRV
jgi:hypothetical protein